MKTLRLGELFSGPGGIGLGAKTAASTNYQIVTQWATDYDLDSCDTYAANVSDRVICHDVRTLDFDRLEELGDIDGLAFGFPCNDFSQVGEQKGLAGEFGPLYQYGVKALYRFKPLFFMAENVSGLTGAKNRAAFDQILHELEQAGYTVTPHTYRFEEYGLPQARHRVVIVGYRDDLGLTFTPPQPGEERMTARQALECPPIPADAPNHELPRHDRRTVERLEAIKPGQNAFTADLPEHLQIKTRVKLSQLYKRLHPDKPAYTLTGSGGGGTHVYHYSEPRALTNRERARLQTFPDDFEFKGGRESVRKQIGMAVPPRGAQIIFDAILSQLEAAGHDFNNDRRAT